MKCDEHWWSLLLAGFTISIGALGAGAELASTQAPRLAEVAGQVVDDLTARPVADALVELKRQDSNIVLEDGTASDGTFRFPRVSAGRYTLRVSKLGYLTANYGARSQSLPGSIIDVSATGRDDLIVHLDRGAAVAGTIRYPTGSPIPAARVEAIRIKSSSDGFVRVSRPDAHLSFTDDDGAYRIFGLEAGRYILTASVNPQKLGSVIRRNSPEELDWLGRFDRERSTSPGLGRNPETVPTAGPDAFVPRQVYYPSGVSPVEAMVLDLDVGLELTALDLTVPVLPATTLRGFVYDVDGEPASGVIVYAVPLVDTRFAAPTTSVVSAGRSRARGEFAVQGLFPGSYSLLAIKGTGTDTRWAKAEINVYAGVSQEIPLTMQPALTVRGQVSGRGAANRRQGLAGRLGLSLRPADARITAVRPLSAVLGDDGAVSFVGVVPGQYRLEARPQDPDIFVASAFLGGVDLLEQAGEVDNDRIVQIVVTDQNSGVAGTVLDQGGEPAAGFYVLVFPADQALWFRQSRRIGFTRTSIDGKYSINRLPPGEYLLAVVSGHALEDFRDPEFLGLISPSGMRTLVQVGQMSTQDLSIRYERQNPPKRPLTEQKNYLNPHSGRDFNGECCAD